MNLPAKNGGWLTCARSAPGLLCITIVLLLALQLPGAALAADPDSAPPRIEDLAAEPGQNATEVKLTWTVPTDALQYVVRYHAEAITSANWDDTVRVADTPPAGSAGSEQSMVIDGLAPGPETYFGIVAKDSGGLASPVSNSPGAKARQYILHAPLVLHVEPGAHTDALAPATYTTEIRLTSADRVAGLVTKDLPVELMFSGVPATQSVVIRGLGPSRGGALYQVDGAVVGDDYQGSAILSANEAFNAVVSIKQEGSGGAAAAVYGARDAAGTVVMLPKIGCGNGTDSLIGLQNPGEQDIGLLIDYSPVYSGTPGSEFYEVPGGGSLVVDLAHGSASPTNCDHLGGPGGIFVGSASVTTGGGKPVYIVVGQVGASSLAAYTGIPWGAPRVEAPLLHTLTGGYPYYTAVAVMDAGSTASTLGVTYSQNRQGDRMPVPETYGLPANGAASFAQMGDRGANDWDAIGPYAGSAKVDSGASDIAALVNTSNWPDGHPSSAYQAVDPATASSSVVLPDVKRTLDDHTFYTLYNAGLKYARGQCTYTPSAAGIGLVPDYFTLVNPGDSRTISTQGAPGTDGGANNWKGLGEYHGSVVCTTYSGVPIVAVANHVDGVATRDQVAAYNASAGNSPLPLVDPHVYEAAPQLLQARLAGGQPQAQAPIFYAYVLVNSSPYRLTDLSVTASRGTVELTQYQVEPGFAVVANGTYTPTAQEVTGPGPLINEVIFGGSRSDGQVVSYTTSARIGLPRLYDASPTEPMSLTVIGGGVRVAAAEGAIPAGGAHLRYTDHGTYPFESPGPGLPPSTVNFCRAFGLALLDAGEQVVANPQFSPPLSLTVTYSQSVVDKYGLVEGYLEVVYYDDEVDEWKIISGVERDVEGDRIAFQVDHLVGKTEFGVVDGKPLPAPLPQNQTRVYLPLVLKGH